MAALHRRNMLVGAAGLWLAAALPVQAKGDWIEVEGSTALAGPADRDAARRRALGDALLAAALAGGAEVRGHSVMSGTRLTSDLLIVRPVGQILGFEIIGESCDGALCRVRIRARVGQPRPSDCAGRRLVVVTAEPSVRVDSSAPAWADTLGHDLALRLIAAAESAPSVASLTRMRGAAPGSRATRAYRDATRQPEAMPEGAHNLSLALRIQTERRDLVLSVAAQLEGPAGEVMTQDFTSRTRLPGASLLGRAAVLVDDDRSLMADRLVRGAPAALAALLARAGCRPVTAVLAAGKGLLSIRAGRTHGLSRSSLAFTVDDLGPVVLLEVAELHATRASLRPLDPAEPMAPLAGRIVRFLDLGQALP